MTKLLTPFFVSGQVVKGFGRGSKQLGIPTANIDTNVVQNISLENGIYYGFCQLLTQNYSNGQQNGSTNGTELIGNGTKSVAPIYPMVCSLGWNPQFNNKIRSLEVHILNRFKSDFYGSFLRVAICGYIRPEEKFDSLERLIETIHSDITTAQQLLKDRNQWSHILSNNFFEQ